MKILFLAVPLLCASIVAAGGAPQNRPPIAPFETSAWTTPATALDKIVESDLAQGGYAFRYPSADEVFLRRIYLDLMGTVPEPEEVAAFTADRSPDRVGRLLDRMFERPEYADYQTMLWCDLLRMKSEFPINLWPNAVQAYSRWVRDAIAANLPYDSFARSLLLGGGSNFRDPPSNFYRAVETRTSEALAGAVALTFLGVRPSALGENRLRSLSAFFARVAYKKTQEWKEEIVYFNPASAETLAVLPDGTRLLIPAGADPRLAFADWLTSKNNPYFARAVVDRTWYRLMGTSLIADSETAPPETQADCPELLDYLCGRLIASGWDLRVLLRTIAESRTYRQSSIPYGNGGETGYGYAFYRIRRLDAEVLADSLGRVGPSDYQYVSPVPEPFTYIPMDQRTTALADGSIASSFLVKFGRPSRNTGSADERDGAISADQVLHFLNSSDIRRRIEKGNLMKKVFDGTGENRDEQVRRLYLFLLSRQPEPEELRIVAARLKGNKAAPKQAAADLAWALINSKEFLYRH